jgi:hypothetical protein
LHPATLRARPTLKAISGHQPSHSVQANSLDFIGQVFLHPADSQSATTVFVHLTHTPQETCIVELAGTRHALASIVITAGKYTQATAHQPGRELMATTLDHLIPQDDPLAKNVAASRKKFSFLLNTRQLALQTRQLLIA